MLFARGAMDFKFLSREEMAWEEWVSGTEKKRQ